MRVVCTFVLLSLCSKLALSGGGFFSNGKHPVMQSREMIAFGISTNTAGDTDVVMQVQLDYSGPAQNFSWILPIRYEPELSIGSDIFFKSILRRTNPVYNFVVNGTLSNCQPSELARDDCRTFMNGPTRGGVANGKGGGGSGGGGRDGGKGGGGSGGGKGDAMPPFQTTTVVEEGFIGPFENAIIKPSQDNPAEAVISWLTDRGYDVPSDGMELIEQYANQDGMMFVALRLQKGTQTGEIQPIILRYTVPGDVFMNTGTTQGTTTAAATAAPVATIPIRLASVSAMPDLPIQVFVFSNKRAIPGNFFSVELDDSRADWLGCKTDQLCYLDDMRKRFTAFLQEEGINGHAFITEYAGSTTKVQQDNNDIGMNVNILRLKEIKNPNDYLMTLAEYHVPKNQLVNTIIEQYIPNEYSLDAPFMCVSMKNVYQKTTSPCYNFLTNQQFDSESLTNELNEKVFSPASYAETFINTYPYLTRFYGQLSKNYNITKDPVFIFNNNDEEEQKSTTAVDDSVDVSNIKVANAIPVCGSHSGAISALNITIGTYSHVIPAMKDCGQWHRTSSGPLFGMDNISIAGQVAADDYIISRPDSGLFPPDLLQELVGYMDQRLQITPESTESTEATQQTPPDQRAQNDEDGKKNSSSESIGTDTTNTNGGTTATVTTTTTSSSSSAQNGNADDGDATFVVTIDDDVIQGLTGKNGADDSSGSSISSFSTIHLSISTLFGCMAFGFVTMIC